MVKKVFEFMEQQHMINQGDRVVAGVSGGADSVCLLLLLWEYQKKILYEGILVFLKVDDVLKLDFVEGCTILQVEENNEL